jgi:4-diphosphocytidyl-2-C-methyl-D-erythritol kinase
VTKRIPTAAGLGGASSDAAAALLAANIGWNVGWSRPELSEVAAELGSDVPLFLHGGGCVCRGRGERIEPLNRHARLELVVVRPPEGLSTGRVYQACQVPERARSVGPLVQALERGARQAVGRTMFNRLQVTAEGICGWLGRLRSIFDRLDLWGHQMSGSGTAYFGICRHARHARRVAACLRAAGLGAVFAATTVSLPGDTAALVRQERLTT